MPDDVLRGTALDAQNCASCHPQAGAMETEELRQAVLQGTEGMPAFPFSGDPDTSLLVVVQRGQHFAHLSTTELDLVIAWIRAGAPHN